VDCALPSFGFVCCWMEGLSGSDGRAGSADPPRILAVRSLPGGPGAIAGRREAANEKSSSHGKFLRCPLPLPLTLNADKYRDRGFPLLACPSRVERTSGSSFRIPTVPITHVRSRPRRKVRTTITLRRGEQDQCPDGLLLPPVSPAVQTSNRDQIPVPCLAQEGHGSEEWPH